MRYKVTLEYNGTQFHGWAKQNDQRTIQGEIEKILKDLYGKDISIHGSGRTDAWVHAKAQVFHFDETVLKLDTQQLLFVLKKWSPKDINFLDCTIVDETFHSRFSSKGKHYYYLINVGPLNIFESDFVYQYNKEIDLEKVTEASKILIGKHNFKSFSSSEAEDSIREIFDIKFEKSDNYLKIHFYGKGFLRYMVRMIVGTLLDINENFKTNKDIIKLIENPKKGTAIRKAPGCGLYLNEVKY